MDDGGFPVPDALRERYPGWRAEQERTARDEPVVARLDGPDGERRFLKVLPVGAEISVGRSTSASCGRARTCPCPT